MRFEDVDGFEITTAMGENSQEVYVQQQRESQNSNAIYWKEESIPESPAEPSDPQATGDSNQEQFIPLIPYEEVFCPIPNKCSSHYCFRWLTSQAQTHSKQLVLHKSLLHQKMVLTA